MKNKSGILKLLNGKYSDIIDEYKKARIYKDEEIKNDPADILALKHKNAIIGVNQESNPSMEFMPKYLKSNGIGYNLKYDEQKKEESKPVETNNPIVNVPEIKNDEKEVQQSIYDKIASDTKREKTLGLLGYGIQGVSALRDLAENASQEYSQPPNDVYNKRIEYKPVDIEPYIAKMEQSEAGYLKYLKETGNGHLIPSLMSMGSQKNELAAKMTEANNQKEVSIAGANAQSDLQTMQINQSLRSDYNKQKFAEMQYRDNSMRSNKSAIFGSIAGMISTGAGATNKELKLEAYKEAIAKGDMQGAYDLIMGMAGETKKANQTYKYQTEE